MTSPARLAANRANARKSTGPRSAEGKKRVSQNARKHGLAAPADATAADVARLADALVQPGCSAPLRAAATAYAMAALDLARTQRIFARLFDADDLGTSGRSINARDARSARRRALKTLTGHLRTARIFDPAISVALETAIHDADAECAGLLRSQRQAKDQAERADTLRRLNRYLIRAHQRAAGASKALTAERAREALGPMG